VTGSPVPDRTTIAVPFSCDGLPSRWTTCGGTYRKSPGPASSTCEPPGPNSIRIEPESPLLEQELERFAVVIELVEEEPWVIRRGLSLDEATSLSRRCGQAVNEALPADGASKA